MKGRMSEARKRMRRFARESGASCRANIAHAISFSQEARDWQALADRPFDADVHETAKTIAEDRLATADTLERLAYANARRAARWFIKSEVER